MKLACSVLFTCFSFYNYISTRGFSMLKLSFILILMAAASPDMSAFEFEDFVNVLFESPCAAVAGSLGGTCYNDYYAALNSPVFFQSAYLRSRQYCCAVGSFQSCVFETIEKACGKEAQAVSRDVVKRITNSHNADFCSGVELIYQPQSPFCWPEAGKLSFELKNIIKSN